MIAHAVPPAFLCDPDSKEDFFGGFCRTTFLSGADLPVAPPGVCDNIDTLLQGNGELCLWGHECVGLTSDGDWRA